MNSNALQSAAIAFVLIAVGIASWVLYLREPLAIDTSSLADFPLEIGQWEGSDIPMLGSVEELLDADFNVQRVYVHRMGTPVWFYLGYYGTQRGGRPEHTPWTCYPSQGWAILERTIIPLGHNEGLSANELLVEKDGTRQLVHFWYQSYHRIGMTSEFDQALERLRGQIVDGRADGSLVRLSTPVDEHTDMGAARSRLAAFTREVMPLLSTHWPQEYETPSS
jgi:EpsI family protein